MCADLLAVQMFMKPGSIVVEIVGQFDGRMTPLCGFHGPFASVYDIHHYVSTLICVMHDQTFDPCWDPECWQSMLFIVKMMSVSQTLVIVMSFFSSCTTTTREGKST